MGLYVRFAHRLRAAMSIKPESEVIYNAVEFRASAFFLFEGL